MYAMSIESSNIHHAGLLVNDQLLEHIDKLYSLDIGGCKAFSGLPVLPNCGPCVAFPYGVRLSVKKNQIQKIKP